MWPFKKECDHDWHELQFSRDYIDYTTCGIPDGREEDVAHIYCPKCDTRKRVSDLDGKLILKANKLKWDYRKNYI